MADVTVANWISDATSIITNPTLIQRLSLQRLKDIKDGLIDVPDATSPFAWLLEASAINTAAFLEANELSTRRQYPSVAQTLDDLYLHMSDKDYLERFATPASSTFYLMIEKNALEKALIYDPTTGLGKVVIPRNTEFKIDDYVFSIQYPIIITKMTHGGYQVTYDITTTSPLQILTSNIVVNEFISPNRDVTFLRLTIPVQQFNIKSFTSTLSSAKLFRKTITFTDEYYYARVFYKNSTTSTKWNEILTTHTDQVYDPTVVTAVLKVEDSSLEVFIPQIYFSTGSISGNIRVDVYQTKGAINLSLSAYSPDDFSASFKAYDDNDETPEVAAFRNINEILVYSTDTINDGSGKLEFTDLRQRVINNTIGSRNLPITNVQVIDSLSTYGFDIVKNVDIVTNRIFLATKDLIKPFDETLVTAAATNMESLIVTMSELAKHPSVYNNGDRITITPDVVYRIDNGQMQVVSSATVNAINNALPEDKASLVAQAQYVYSPFYYVLDATDSQFKFRSYHMDAPVADLRQFIGFNDSTAMQANTQEFTFTKLNFGYRLSVQVLGNDAFNNLDDSKMFAQLFFTPIGEVSSAYINGTLTNRTTNGGAVFIFDINTKFDVDVDNNLYLTSFTMDSLLGNPLACNLLQDFNLIYGAYDINTINWTQSNIDNNVGQFLLTDHGFAITQESFRLQFGVYLENLWTGSRSFPSSQQYQKYTADVPAVYTENVFQTDPVTKSIFSLDANNNIVYNYLHKKGDTIYDDNGDIVYAHKAGDLVYDSDGNPVVTSELEVARQLDILVVEGEYYFSTDPSSKTYKLSFVTTMVDWITQDIETIAQEVLEQTEIYYYPKSNMGNLSVIVENANNVSIAAGQSFTVKLYVTESVMQNAQLRDSITTTVIKIIDTELKSPTIAISNIEYDITSQIGSDIIANEVTGLGGAANYQAVTMINTGDKFSIKKKLTAQHDGTLIVQEDVNVIFIQHTT